MSPVHRQKKGSKKSVNSLRLATKRMRTFLWASKTGDEPPLRGFCFISELLEGSVVLYAGEGVKKGASVRVAFEFEEASSYRGIVSWCNRHSGESHFIPSAEMTHRLGLKLLFRSEAERQRYAAFVQESQQRALVVQPGMNF